MNSIIKVETENIKSSEIHLLPCKIDYNGISDVQSFFVNSIIKNDKEPESNY
jgi:hypothetical protein